jgi:hypothetical protein
MHTTKRFWWIAGLGLTCGMLAIGLLKWWPHSNGLPELTDKDILEARLRLGATMAQPEARLPSLSLNQPVRLAIGGFGLTDAKSGAGQALGDLVTAELSGVNGLELVERQALDKVLTEMQLIRSGLLRAKDAVAVGNLVRADWFLLGSTARLKDTTGLVLRLVDARTGILRDAGVVNADRKPTQIAADISEFVRQSRQAAASARTRVYLAIGSFEDLSVNNRLTNFPTELRAYLVAAYRNNQVTLLEREYVDALLEEVRLDWSGLAGQHLGDTAQPMQSAFWLVDGCYQSDEKEDPQIQVTLEIRRVFGRTKRVTLQNRAGEPLHEQIKKTIDSVMTQDRELLIPTWMSEVRSQMALGKELGHIQEFRVVNWLQDEQELARRRRNAEEAIHAFQTVLLLEPTNREAKVCLASCFQIPEINDFDKAVGYYREVLEEPVQDRFTDEARAALHLAWTFSDPQERPRSLEAASANTANPAAAAFYKVEAERARVAATFKEGGPEARQLAEQRLFGVLTNAFISDTRSRGVDEFVATFGTNQAAAAQRLIELYPGLKAAAPQLGPYFLAAIVTVQTASNAPIVTEFDRMLDEYTNNPTHVFMPDNFWWLFSRELYDWCFDHERYSLAAKFIESKIRAAALLPNHPWGIKNDDRITLGFAYMGAEEWGKALQIFETYSNQPVRMESWGPWGRSLAVVSTAARADYCRRKLGQTVNSSSRQFPINEPVLNMCYPSTFVAGETGAWLGIGARLLHLDHDLHTNQVVTLPIDEESPVTALAVTPSTVWAGTAGAGLIRFDKNTGETKRFTTDHGLMLNRISCLAIADLTLWIGYGEKSRHMGIATTLAPGGGLGRLDLATQKFRSFVPPITSRKAVIQEAADQPTLLPVQTLAVDANSDVWLASVNQYLRHYAPTRNLWEESFYFGTCTSLASDKTRLVAAWYSNSGGDPTGDLGVSTFDLRDRKWSYLGQFPELPAGVATALVPNEDELWVAGAGYVARFDLRTRGLLNYSYLPSTVVRLQIGGGYLWIQCPCHIHRVLLSDVR